MIVPDFDSYPITNAARSVEVTEKGRCLHVIWDDGKADDYHVHLLRENAPDEETIHPVTREHNLMLNEIDEHLKIVNAEIQNDGIKIKWSDNNSHLFHLGWLRAWKDDAFFALPKRELWSKDFTPPVSFYDEVKNDLQKRLEWLENFYRFGACILSKCPNENATIEEVAKIIGTIKPTNFGTLFDVQLKHEDADSNAYTSLPLPLHVDLATREYQPGLQFLHCMTNTTSGGYSNLMDGFMMAKGLKEAHPKEYELLTSVNLIQATKAKTTDYRYESPIIVCDNKGEVTEMRYNPWLRAPINYDFATTDAIYKAIRVLYNFAESDRFKISFLLKPGDIMCFDNRRIMHGRTGFDADNASERHLRGCYIDREELDSAIRMTKRYMRAEALSS